MKEAPKDRAGARKSSKFALPQKGTESHIAPAERAAVYKRFWGFMFVMLGKDMFTLKLSSHGFRAQGTKP